MGNAIEGEQGMGRQPVTELDERYSDGDTPIEWSEAVAALTAAELFWISTVRDDGRPHVTPLIGLWLDDALHFVTGVGEQKYRNLRGNQHVVMTTGVNTWAEGLDLVIEGSAVQVSDDERLQTIADGFVEKYGEVWRFHPQDGYFHHEHGLAAVFEIQPVTGYGYSKGSGGTHTRWRFGD